MMFKWFNINAKRHARDESGASLIEYTIVVVLFLLVFFAILDFGRLGFNWVMTEKAMQRAARIAVVRPPICNTATSIVVPEIHAIAAGAQAGTLCRAGGCASPHTAGSPPTCVLGNVTRTTTQNRTSKSSSKFNRFSCSW